MGTWSASTKAASYLGPEPGQVAPTLNITKWLQAPDRTGNTWPTGKVVVLEFWSTWCGPCVAAIPHLNDLAAKFKDKPVQFISVTDEKAEVVQTFLKKKPINAWIGLTAEPLFTDKNPYGVYAIPHTVLIDVAGKIAATLNPEALTAVVIEQCLKGKLTQRGPDFAAAKYPEPDPDVCPEVGVVPGQSQIGRTPIYQILIRPSASKSDQKVQRHTIRSSRSDFGITLPESTVRQAILQTFNTTPCRVALETKLPTDRYDFYIFLPPRDIPEHLKHPGKMLEAAFAQAVQTTFGVAAQRELREMAVLVLRTNATSTAKLAHATTDGKAELFGLGEMTGEKRSLTNLADGLENCAGQPVLDETGVTNLYSFHLKWEQRDFNHPNQPAMIEAVNKLGLELIPEKRPVEMLVIRGTSQ